MPQIVQECKKALKGLSNLSDDLLFNKAHTFDQVIQLMKKHLRNIDVFLAIDNVWKSSSEAAKRILGVGFSTKRRSFSNFQEAFGGDAFESLENCRDQVEHIIDQKFVFAGNYHALALKALGGHVRNVCMPGESKKINKDLLSHILQQITNKDLGEVEDAIRLAYDNIPEHKQHMFLDIAVLMPLCDTRGRVTFAKAHQWLSVLYKDEFVETKILELIYQLARDGLVQIETDGRGERILRVHDLLADLAHREAATSSRFFINGSSNKPVAEIEWEKLDRLILSPAGGLREWNVQKEVTQIIEKRWQQPCRKLQVLYAAGVDFFRGFDMRRMPSMCVLYLRDVTLERVKNWSAASKLGIVFLLNMRVTPAVLNLKALTPLQVLHVEGCEQLERIEGLDSLKNLQSLLVRDCHCLQILNGLCALPQLKALHVVYCDRLKKKPDLSRMSCLEELVLDGNEKMEGGGGFSLAALKILRIRGCGALTSTPDLSGSTHLEALELSNNGSLKEVQGVVSSTLTDLVIDGPLKISGLSLALEKKTLDFSCLTCLDRVQLAGLWMKELGGLSSTIRIMRVSRCKQLKRMPDVSGLTRLESLQLLSNYKMEEVGCLSSTLKYVLIDHCEALRKMPDLSGLTRLEGLTLSNNGLLEEVGCLSSTLKTVTVVACEVLKKMPDLSGLTRFEGLELEANISMEEVGGQYLSSTLKNLCISYCEGMRSVPMLKDCVHLREVTATPDVVAVVIALSAPPNLHTLRLRGGKWLSTASCEQWKGLPLLKELIVESVDAVRIDLGCFSRLVNLESLTVSSCHGLEEIANSGELQGLERLKISLCPHLKKLDGVRDMQTYTRNLRSLGEELHLQRCPAREEIHWSISVHPRLAPGSSVVFAG